MVPEALVALAVLAALLVLLNDDEVRHPAAQKPSAKIQHLDLILQSSNLIQLSNYTTMMTGNDKDRYRVRVRV